MQPENTPTSLPKCESSYHTATHPKSINSRHRALMWRLAIGEKREDVAKDLGFSMVRISQIMQSELFQSELRELQQMIGKQVAVDESTKLHGNSVREKLASEAMASLNMLVGLRDNAQSERIKQLSAIEILNKAGYKECERVEADVHIDASEGLINAIQKAVGDGVSVLDGTNAGGEKDESTK